MSTQFRTPPSLEAPAVSRWEAVFQLTAAQELWILNFRTLHSGFYPVLCELQDNKPVPLYPVPQQAPQISQDHRLIPAWGHRFFGPHTKRHLRCKY